MRISRRKFQSYTINQVKIFFDFFLTEERLSLLYIKDRLNKSCLTNFLGIVMRNILFILSILLSTHTLFSQTQVEGQISVNTTWTVSNSPYLVVGNITVASTAKLSIEAGVVVKFNPSRSLYINGGKLDVKGTSSNPVVFTSYRDDEYGGDSNNDGNATEPAKGDWNQIVFESGSNVQNVFEYCIVRYGGRYS